MQHTYTRMHSSFRWMRACTYARMHTRVHTHAHIHTRAHTRADTHVHTRAHTHTCILVLVRVRMCVRGCVARTRRWVAIVRSVRALVLPDAVTIQMQSCTVHCYYYYMFVCNTQRQELSRVQYSTAHVGVQYAKTSWAQYSTAQHSTAHVCVHHAKTSWAQYSTVQ